MSLLTKRRTKYPLYFVVAIVVGIIGYLLHIEYQKKTMTQPLVVEGSLDKMYSKIVFAGGCFWCTEAEFDHTPGVVEAISGYIGGTVTNPTYEEVSSGTTGHREAVLVYYNEASTTIEKLLVTYWKHIDPTDEGGQFVDRGKQYTTAIYYTTEAQQEAAKKSEQQIVGAKKFTKPTVTELLPYTTFYPAEEYHQNYKDKNPVRYEYYRDRSGRNNFIQTYWKNDTTTFSTTTMSTSTKKAWEQFIKPEDGQLRKRLTEEQYTVTQHEGTERPFNNLYADNKEKGIYVDIVSGEPLFLSSDKYDSGTGWPSFVKPLSNDVVTLHEDKRLFSTRTEVRSAIADSHLGHVFPDGPKDRGGMRYCMNSAALRFVPLAEMENEGYGEYISQIK
jgi:peptide methionine sulfoxide reductase msrA/msrB